ncbi:hypothetical protein Tco_0052383 [Tanacetum coccineum]
MKKKSECAEEQSAEDRYWQIPIANDDDETAIPLQSQDPYDNFSSYVRIIDYNRMPIPPDAEIVSLEVVEIVDPEVGRINDDILLTIKDDIISEKLIARIVKTLVLSVLSIRISQLSNPQLHFGNPIS